MRLLLATLCSVTLLACGDGYVERPTQAVFDPAMPDFWSVPLPSGLRTQQNGTSNLERWPGPRPDVAKMWLAAIDDRVRDRWGVNTGAFFDLSGALDESSLPTPEASLAQDAAVGFLDIDPASPDVGTRFPVESALLHEELPFQKPGLLSVIPVIGFTRRPNTLYAVVLTDALKDASGTPLGRSRAFHLAWENQEGADARAVAELKPLRDYYLKNELDPAHVVGATVFRTIDLMSPLTKLAAWVETLPAPALTEAFARLDTYPDFALYAGAYTVPQVQDGRIPGYGRIVWNGDDTAPVQQGSQRVRLSLSVPTTPPPPGGYPLMIYLHGSGGEYREGMDRGPLAPTTTRDKQGDPPPGTGPAAWLAKRGIAVLGFDFPLHGDRDTPPDTSGLRLYNLFGDIDSTVDNMTVSAMEVVYLTRLIETLQVPTQEHGTVSFDLSKLTAMGHSMGSTIGIPVATVDPRIKAYVFSGSGGLLTEVATTASYPVELRSFVELLLGFTGEQRLTARHPLLNAFQALWDFTDPVAKARYVAREPLGGRPPRPALQPQGTIDGYFHPGAQAAVTGALGSVMAGDATEPVMLKALERLGRPLQPYPLEGNVNGVTVGTLHFETPYELGHFVVFDREEVQHQVRCFLEGVGTAEGPALVAPAAYDAACQ